MILLLLGTNIGAKLYKLCSDRANVHRKQKASKSNNTNDYNNNNKNNNKQTTTMLATTTNNINNIINFNICITTPCNFGPSKIWVFFQDVRFNIEISSVRDLGEI
jgi:hypothetical protein